MDGTVWVSYRISQPGGTPFPFPPTSRIWEAACSVPVLIPGDLGGVCAWSPRLQLLSPLNAQAPVSAGPPTMGRHLPPLPQAGHHFPSRRVPGQVLTVTPGAPATRPGTLLPVSDAVTAPHPAGARGRLLLDLGAAMTSALHGAVQSPPSPTVPPQPLRWLFA